MIGRAFRLVAVLAASLAVYSLADASDFAVREARSIDGKILCNSKSDAILQTSGPCSGYTPPPKVAVGETFTANGKTRKIGVVETTPIEKEYKDEKIELKKGNFYCLAAETAADLDIEHNKNALWILIPNCEPIPKPISPLNILAPGEFLKLPLNIQSIFVGGILEGMSFSLYGNYTPEYPAWVSCVRQKPLGDTTNDVVAFLQKATDFHENIATAVAMSLGKRCKH